MAHNLSCVPRFSRHGRPTRPGRLASRVRGAAPFVGSSWASSAVGAALVIARPGGKRLLFCAHHGAYQQDVVFFSDDGGVIFNVSASTPFGAGDTLRVGRVLVRPAGQWERPHDRSQQSAAQPHVRRWRAVQGRRTQRRPGHQLGRAHVLGGCAHRLVRVCDSSWHERITSRRRLRCAPTRDGRASLRASRDDGERWVDVRLLDAGRVAYSQLVTLETRPKQIASSAVTRRVDDWRDAP